MNNSNKTRLGQAFAVAIVAMAGFAVPALAADPATPTYQQPQPQVAGAPQQTQVVTPRVRSNGAGPYDQDNLLNAQGFPRPGYEMSIEPGDPS